MFKELVDEKDEAVLADSGYLSESAREHLLKCDCEDFIQLKSYRNRPLSEAQKRTNKLRSRIRVRVEHVFGRMSQLAMDRLRTIGMVRARQHNGLSNLVYNMDQLRLFDEVKENKSGKSGQKRRSWKKGDLL